MAPILVRKASNHQAKTGASVSRLLDEQPPATAAVGPKPRHPLIALGQLREAAPLAPPQLQALDELAQQASAWRNVVVREGAHHGGQCHSSLACAPPSPFGLSPANNEKDAPPTYGATVFQPLSNPQWLPVHHSHRRFGTGLAIDCPLHGKGCRLLLYFDNPADGGPPAAPSGAFLYVRLGTGLGAISLWPKCELGEHGSFFVLRGHVVIQP